MWPRRANLFVTSRSPCHLALPQNTKAFRLGSHRRRRNKEKPVPKSKDFFNGRYENISIIDASHRLCPHGIAYFVIGRHDSENKEGIGNTSKHPTPEPGFSARMLVKTQLATVPTADTPGTSVMLHFDNKRYIFGNIAEGTQRAMTQRKTPLNKAQGLFVSGVVDWRNCGGVIGAVLTIADTVAAIREAAQQLNKDRRGQGKKEVAVGPVPRLDIHGGKNLSHFLATARRFIFRKGLPLTPHEIKSDSLPKRTGNGPDWKDENINVWYMPLELPEEVSTSKARKRSHEEFIGDLSEAGLGEDIAAAVVEQMFNSKWSMDALHETTVHQVHASSTTKLFVRDNKGHLKPYTGPMPDGSKPLKEIPDIPVLCRQPWPGAMVDKLPSTQPSKQSICYIVKKHASRGKFLPQEAMKYGVAKTDYKLLTAGQTVKGKDGIEVTPSMVLGDTVEGTGFAFVDLPNRVYIEALVTRSEWASPDIMSGIQVIYWSLGPDVAEDGRLQEFMQKLSSIRHIVCAPDLCPNAIVMESVATQTYKLHAIDPDRFPLPHFNNAESARHTPVPSKPSQYEIGRAGHTIQLAPQVLVQEDQIYPFSDIPKLAAADTDSKLREEIAALTADAKTRISDPAFLAKVERIESDIPNRDAEIITLGTGSALPSKYRNVSATLIRVPGYGNYLLDCGENTLGQLGRVFGPELPSILKELKGIWISHLHADHHLGTAGVIKAWNEATSANLTDRLFVASHSGMLQWLREYAEVEDYGYGRVHCVKFEQARRKIIAPRVFDEVEQAMFGVQRIDACYVDHCVGALAGVLTWPSGLKIAYSGDCRPSDAFVEIGQGTTLLIHESTFDDDLKGDAIAKKHSTMSEALDVGRRMGARRILLTHFSQRYQKIANMGTDVFGIQEEIAGKEKARLDEVCLVAFDYMRVKLGDFRKAQSFIPAVQKLFEDIDDQQDQA